MMGHRVSFWLVAIAAFFLIFHLEKIVAQDADKEKLLAQRFQSLFEKNPRRGTALDRVYGYYAEIGELQELIDTYGNRTKASPDDAKSWFILGLLEAKRGADAESIAAFQQAEKHGSDNALASYYLGQAYVLAGQNKEATAAIERAIKKKPLRNDLLEMYQTLGRIHQRAHRNDEALDVWSRLEKQFPGDQRVAEQIAAALSEEEQYEEALKRYQRLVEATKNDLYRRVIYQIEAANMVLRLGKKEEALQDFEKLLSQLKPESWLHQQVRGKIEAVYRQADDLAGLANYYESWIGHHPEDLGAMSRLAIVLATSGRGPEARKWFDKAIELAPTRIDLRQALIDQLVYERKFADAIKQYEQLDKVDSNNPDHIRQWGLLILKDKSRTDHERKDAATQIWMKLVESRPNDAVMVTQAADLLRQAEVFDEAEKLYQRAIELKPNEGQYREYLGEFYHNRDRKDEALTTWKQIVDPPRNSAANLHRLAEVLSGFGYIKPAIEYSREACQIDDSDFNMHITLVDLLEDDKQFDEMLVVLQRMLSFASNLEELEGILDRQIIAYQGNETLDDQIAQLTTALSGDQEKDSESWRRLARFLEAKRLQADAIEAAAKAIALDSKSIPGFRLIARLYENTGDLAAASQANSQLAVIDSRFKTTYLTEVARLESRLGRTDKAIQAGRDLIAAAPGNPEHYHFFADLCFQLGKNDEGLKTLRRAVRANPSDYEQLLKLGSALSRQFRVPEAIELYWQAFDKSDELNDRISIISQLADLYLQQNQFDALLSRLERMRRESKEDRIFAFCVAAAHLRGQDFAAARSELAVFLAQNDRDTHLLEQIGQIAEQEGDLDAAIKYQIQLLQLAPNLQRRRRLSQLYMKSDQLEEAETLMAEMALEQEKVHQIYKTVDELTAYDRLDGAKSITTQLVRDNPRSWESLYRDGVVLAKMDKIAAAKKRFEQLMALELKDDEKSAAQKEQARRNKNVKTRSSAIPFPSRTSSMHSRYSLHSRIQDSHSIRSAVGLQADNRYYGSGSRRSTWAPSDYGFARMASIAWLYKFAKSDKDSAAEFESQYAIADETLPEFNQTKRRQMIDALYFAAAKSDLMTQYEIARRLSHDGSVQTQTLHLQTLGYRTGNQYYNPNNQQKDITPALSKADMDHVLACFRNVQKNDPKGTSQLLGIVLAELKRAQRDEEDHQLYQVAMEEVADIPSAIQMASLAGTRGDVKQFSALLERIANLMDRESVRNQRPSASLHPAAAQLMWMRAKQDAHPEIPGIYHQFEKLCLAEQTIQDATNRRSRSFNYAQSSSNYVQIYRPGGHQYVQASFPGPVKHLSHPLYSVLKNAHEIYKKDDLVSDLMKFLQDRRKDAKGNQAISRSLALAYVTWWDEDVDAAVELIEAATIASNDTEMRFLLADAFTAVEDPERAIETLDSISAMDRKTVQAREKKILDMSVQVGFVERAREAAERLFGVRMRADEQVQLAKQMHQLGLHELGEAVLRRARRRTGGNRNNMLAVMSSYQQQGKMDIAVQIAHQILRVNRSPNSRGQDNVRDQALRVLSQSGRLKDIIARAEKQLEQSPNSPRLLKNLAEFYTASRDTEKARAIYKQLAEATPDNARMRYELADMLRAAGEKDEAIKQYILALSKDISVFNRNYWEVQQFFQSCNKTAELLKVFAEADLTKTSDPWTIINVLNSNRDDQNVELAVKIFKKLWDAHPSYRSSLMSNVSYRKKLLEKLELYDYASTAFLDANINYSYVTHGWQAMSMIHSWSTNSVESSAGMLLKTAEQQKKLDDLRKRLNQKMEKMPEWTSGKAMLALIDLREGKSAKAKKVLEELLFDKEDPISGYAAMVVGNELQNHKEFEPMLLRLYENSMSDPQIRQTGLGFDHGIGGRLVKLYEKAGRRDEAIQMILKESRQPIGQQYDPQYAAYRWLRRQIELGTKLLELDCPVGAMRIFREVESQPDKFQLASRYGGSYYTNQYKQGLEKASNSVTPKMIFEELISPSSQSQSTEEKGVTKGQIDLMMFVETSGEQAGTLRSPIADAISKQNSQDPLSIQLRDSIRKRANQTNDDWSVAIVHLLAELNGGTKELAQMAVDRLTHLLNQQPLEELASKRANARQRREAETQIFVWFAAQACLANEHFQQDGHRFANRAIAAAERQIDKSHAAAMLQSMGLQMVKSGNREMAREYWQRMLELLIDRPLSPKPDPAASGLKTKRQNHSLAADITNSAIAMFRPDRLLHSQVAFSLAPGSASAKRRVFKKGHRPVTTSEFKKIVNLAKLTASYEMSDLSLRCIEEALQAGPPIVSHGSANMMGSFRPVPSSASTPSDTADVQTAIGELINLWDRKNVHSKDIYRILAHVVFPPQRTGEVFLYEAPISLPDNPDVDSLGQRLVEIATAAGKLEDLRSQLKSRVDKPLAQLPVKVLETYVALESEDIEQSKASLQWFLERLKTDSQQNTIQLALLASLPALQHEPLEEAAIAVLDQATHSALTDPNSAHSQNIQMMLARFDRKKGRKEAASRRLRELGKNALASLMRNSSTYTVRRKLVEIGQEQGRFGNLDDTLDFLGRLAEMPIERYSYQSYGSPLMIYAQRMLRELSPSDRYEKLLPWMMPTENRKSLRVAPSFLYQRLADEQFYSKANRRPIDLPPDRFGSIAELLVEDAKHLDKLDELCEMLKPCVDEKMEFAQTVYLMTQLANKNGKAVQKQMVARAKKIKERSLNRQNSNQMIPWEDVFFVRACLKSDAYQELGLNLSQRLEENSIHQFQNRMIRNVRRHTAALLLKKSGLPENDPLFVAPPLTHWHAADLKRSSMTVGELTEDWWAEVDGLLCHLTGCEHPYMFFKYPLEGDFEFSVDAYDGPWGEAQFGYGGFQIDPRNWESLFSLRSPGGVEEGKLPLAHLRRGDFNAWKVKSCAGKVQYWCNGRVVVELSRDELADPFFALIAGGPRKCFFRNVKLTGNPTVPQQIRLLAKNHLGGWIPSHFAEQRTKQWTGHTGRAQTVSHRPYRTVPANDTSLVTWTIEDGVLLGKLKTGSQDSNSLLFYYRPMLDQESVEYDFFHDSGTMVHPCLDRLAFLISKDSVKLHWIKDGRIPSYSEIDDDNRIDLQQTNEIPLKAAAWNNLKVHIEDGNVTLTLNGSVIAKHPISAHNTRHFGFFRFKDRTRAKIRNIVLRGDWPKDLGPIQSDLLARNDTPSSAIQQTLTTAIGERAFSLSTDHVLETANAFNATDSYEYLKNWVLPSPTHAGFRLHGVFPERQGMSGQGNVLQSPVYRLLQVAGESNQFAKLEQEVEAHASEATSRYNRRCVSAVKVLMALERNDTSTATSELANLKRLASRVALETPLHQRWPELLVLYQIAERSQMANASPEDDLVVAARAILQMLHAETVRMQDKGTYFFDELAGPDVPYRERILWTKYMRWIKHRFDANFHFVQNNQALSTGWGSDWICIGHTNSAMAGKGIPHAEWSVQGDEVFHATSSLHDGIYYRHPLVGNFKFRCELLGQGQHQLRIGFAGLCLNLSADGKTLEIRKFDRLVKNVELPKSVDWKSDAWCTVALVVEDRVMKLSYQNQKVFERKLPAQTDPWLFLYADENSRGGVRHCQVESSPGVEGAFLISGYSNLGGWHPYFDQSVLRNSVAWTIENKELRGAMKEPEQNADPNSLSRMAPKGSRQEHWIRYHRPLLENSEVSYEFYYEPEKMAVYPTVGRQAFVLHPTGVHLHRVTNAQWSRSFGQDTEVESKIKSTALPLKKLAWNRVVLRMEGNTVEIMLNDQVIFDQEISAETRKDFGLFHFADQTSARVKNVRLQIH